MTIPRSTYRLQFRQGMTFARAAALSSYWRELGISHLYASPVFAAVKGSTHGYDVTDCNALDGDLGGEAAFRAMAAALKGDGLRLILDVVPNHMAASTENAWWRAVLADGPQSAYARHLDIDWAAGPLTLPFLGESFEEAATAGKFALADRETGTVLRYYENDYPLNAEGCTLVRGARNGGVTLEALARDPVFLSQVHRAQHWRLADWRTGRDKLTYRRFFEISGLVGLRVEDPSVFEDVHEKLFELIDEGLVDGIRLDHIDGLADPQAYLDRLRARVGADVYIVVEKILEADEHIPSTWPIAGATGYEFISSLARVLTASEGAHALDGAYRAFTKDQVAYETQVADAKREIVAHNLAAEQTALVSLASRAYAAAWPGAWGSSGALAAAVAALTASVPVYRTYVGADRASPVDRAVVAESVRRAIDLEPAVADLIRALGQVLVLDVPGAARADAISFVTRFQQTTGAVMAKGTEDTAFYRFNRLIALNEVGGDPAHIGGSVRLWHDDMIRRNRELPHGLSATASHDTKRGEDARARIYAISEAPDLWHRLVARWSQAIGAPAVDSETQWLLFQSLLGVWPVEVPFDQPSLVHLAARFSGFAEKAVREAKRRTSWFTPDADYEAKVRALSLAIFAEDNAAFRAEFDRDVRAFVRAGAVTSLTQCLIKLTAPGVPDIYQGTEGWDLSLVDPDNRQPIDFAGLSAAVTRAPEFSAAHIMADWKSAAPKRHVLMAGLRARAASPEIFSGGEYEPLSVTGPRRAHIVAYARRHAGRTAVVIAPRCVLEGVAPDGPLAVRPEWLAGTVIDLRKLGAASLRNALTGDSVDAASVRADEILKPMPVALLTT